MMTIDRLVKWTWLLNNKMSCLVDSYHVKVQQLSVERGSEKGSSGGHDAYHAKECASLRVKRSKSAFWVSSSTTLFFILSLLVPCFLGETPLKLWVAYQPKTQHINFLSTPSRFSSWVFHAPTQLIQETV
ncbi:hypothetical protein V6N11_056789 [Hibiscus sabdariffa]|uniref:Transmembrane protein n=1 Tax=Hibiscus sabdariffa TaxID=183260 RepID=A0ABR2T5P4_9ROSI